MRYTVTIDNHVYSVDIADLHTRPVIATIDGETFEVWPEAENGRLPASAQQNESQKPPRQVAPSSLTKPGIPAAPLGERSKVVRAPIPGMITEVLVQVGQSVTTGQPLCVLDAMKMSNTIYAARNGDIAHITISVGQHVKHSDIMFEFAD